MNLKLENSVKTIKEGYRNFDLKSFTEEERQLIENIVDAIWQKVAPEGGEFLDLAFGEENVGEIESGVISNKIIKQ